MYADTLDAPVGSASPAEGENPLHCFPPSWERGSGCHGTAWTFLPGQNGVLFPRGVGMRIGVENLDLQHLVLEIHYDQAGAVCKLHSFLFVLRREWLEERRPVSNS